MKYTYDIVKNRFEERGYSLLSETYKNNKEYLIYTCSKHQNKGEMKITFSNFLKGNGCVYCAYESGKHLSKIPNDIVQEEVEKRGNIYVDSVSINNKTCFRFLCSKHLDKGVQEQNFQDLKKGKCGCKFCNGLRENEDFQILLNNKFSTIKLIGNYNGTRKRVKVKCIKHNYTWEPYAYNLISGHGCPKCAIEKNLQRIKISTDELQNRFSSSQPNAELITQIDNISSVSQIVEVKCKICNMFWKTSFHNLTKTNHTSCPKCSLIKNSSLHRKSNSTFLKELESLDTTVIPLEEYKSSNKEKILCSCKKHKDVTWYQSPTSILLNQNPCPKCSHYITENNMLQILDKYRIKYPPQKRFNDCRDVKPLPFDAYLEDYNVALEYDGEGHYMEIPRSKHEDTTQKLKKVQYHDSLKNIYCEKNGIILIRIPYWEKNNLEEFLLLQLSKHGIHI